MYVYIRYIYIVSYTKKNWVDLTFSTTRSSGWENLPGAFQTHPKLRPIFWKTGKKGINKDASIVCHFVAVSSYHPKTPERIRWCSHPQAKLWKTGVLLFKTERFYSHSFRWPTIWCSITREPLTTKRTVLYPPLLDSLQEISSYLVRLYIACIICTSSAQHLWMKSIMEPIFHPLQSDVSEPTQKKHSYLYQGLVWDRSSWVTQLDIQDTGCVHSWCIQLAPHSYRRCWAYDFEVS